MQQVLQEQDAELIGQTFGGDTAENFEQARWALQLHVTAQQSPVLSESTYYDSQLGFTFIAVSGEHVYVNSTIGLDLPANGFRPLPIATLTRAFDAAVNRFTRVTLQNTDLSEVAERTRSQSAYSLANVAPDLGDYFKAPSTITGVATSTGLDGVARSVNRYVGFGNARIREHGQLSPTAYLAWLGSVHQQLLGAGAEAPIFTRYAEPVDCREPVATNILLETADLDDFVDSAGTTIPIDDICSDVSADRFDLRVGEPLRSVGATIKWDGSRYSFNSPDIDSIYSNPARPSESFSSYVTERQAFRLIVHDRDPNTVPIYYVNSQFVRPRSSLSLNSTAPGCPSIAC